MTKSPSEDETVYFDAEIELKSRGVLKSRRCILTSENIYIFDRNKVPKQCISISEIHYVDRSAQAFRLFTNDSAYVTFCSAHSEHLLDLITQIFRRSQNKDLPKKNVHSIYQQRKTLTSEKSEEATQTYTEPKWAELWIARLSKQELEPYALRQFRVAVELSNYSWIDAILKSNVLIDILTKISTDMLPHYLWTLRTIMNSDEAIESICKSEEVVAKLADSLTGSSRDTMIDIIQILCYICLQSKEHQALVEKHMIDSESKPLLSLGKELVADKKSIKLNINIITLINIIFAGMTNREKKIQYRSMLNSTDFGDSFLSLRSWLKNEKVRDESVVELYNAISNFRKEDKLESVERNQVLTTKVNELEEMIRIYKTQINKMNIELEKKKEERESLIERVSIAEKRASQAKVESGQVKEDKGVAGLDFSRKPAFLGDIGKEKTEDKGVAGLDFSRKPAFLGDIGKSSTEDKGVAGLDFSRKPAFLGDIGKDKTEDKGVSGMDFSRKPAFLNDIGKSSTEDKGLAGLDFSKKPAFVSQAPKKVEVKKETNEEIANRIGLHKLNIEKPSKPLNPVFWNPLSLHKVKDTIWKDLTKEPVKMDLKELEALFEKEGKKASAKPVAKKASAPRKFEVFGGMKIQTVTFFFRNIMNLITKENPGLKDDSERTKYFCEALQSCNSPLLTTEILQKLQSALPSDQEKNVLITNKDTDLLGPLERFYLALIEIPDLLSIINNLIFINDFSTTFAATEKNIVLLESALHEIQNSKGLRTFLKVLLHAGNVCNSHNEQRRNAYGFDLAFLSRLKGITSKDRKTSLLEFVYKVLLNNYQEIRLFIYELKSVPAASRLEVVGILADMRGFVAKFTSLNRIAENEGPLAQKVKEFLEKEEKRYLAASEKLETLQNVTFEKTAKLFDYNGLFNSAGDFFKMFAQLISDFENAIVSYNRKAPARVSNKVDNAMSTLVGAGSGAMLDNIRVRGRQEEENNNK